MGQKSIKIIILTTSYRPLVGGSEIAIEEITRRLPNIFFNIITPRYKSSFPKEEILGNVIVRRVGLGLPLDKFLLPVLGFFKALKILKKGDSNIIHSYQASYGSGAAWLLKLFVPKVKFMLTLQEGKDFKKQSFLTNLFRKLIIKRADVVTAISNYLADCAREVNARAEILVIPNGADIQKLKIKDHNQKVIITVSRLVEKNGIEDLIEAFKILDTKYLIHNTRLLIVGDGPLMTSLKFKVESLKLEDKVILAGEISHDQLPGYLAGADVFARPSLSEGLGSAFLEAMAVGLPVIGTPVGGIPDFLKDGETGLFCRVNDPEDLAEKIMNLLNDNDLRIKLSENARKLVNDRYNWDSIANKFGELYAQN